MPQERQLVLTLPTEKYDMERGALVGVARGIQWWDPGMPVHCKIVNRGNLFAKLVRGHPVAHMITVNTRDSERFCSLVDSSPSSTLDPRAPSPEQPRSTKPAVLEHQPHEQVRVEDANCGQLSVKQRAHLDSLLHHFISGGLFPTDPKHVPACVDGELSLPLIDGSCTPVAEKQRRFSPQEISMTTEEIHKKKDGTMRPWVDWRRLKSLLVIDRGGLGDVQSMFSNLKGKGYFTQIDLASGFHQLPIAEKGKHKTDFRDADGQLWEFNRAGFGLTVLPAAFTRIVKTAPAPPEESVVSWLDDILITNTTWEEHLDTIHNVFIKLRTAGLSVNFVKCKFAASAQVFLGMMVDINGIRPAPSKMEPVAKMPRPTNIEELRAFLGLTGYLMQFNENYSIIAVPFTDILRNKEFATKRARKLPISWTVEQEGAFASLKKSLASPTVLAFPDWNQPFTLHTDVSSIGAGAILTQIHGSKEVVIAYASHRFSRTDSSRGPTERECMAVLWGVGHYRQFLAGRRFNLITDCSALTWLFRSRNLSPKLHRWALRLAEYDIVLRWRAGTENFMPDALS